MTVYATPAQLAADPWGLTPPDAVRLLVRASEVITETTLNAVYDVDTAGAATDAGVLTALADATCAQVEYWLTGDEEDDILGPTQGLGLAGLSVQFGAGENRATPMYLGPRAYRILNNAGLCRSAVQS